jgi:hypothetical protein
VRRQHREQQSRYKIDVSEFVGSVDVSWIMECGGEGEEGEEGEVEKWNVKVHRKGL